AVAFGWDNEFDRHVVHVPSFEIDVLPVTNAQFLDFLNDRGYDRRELWSDEGWEWIQSERVSHPAFWERSSDSGQGWQWRAMFHGEPLPPQWPVYVSH